MKKYLCLLFVITLLSCQEKKPPNVVFILVDDLGWADLGYMGSTFYETPNIDALSKQSVQFTNAYASGSVCSPSRAAIMTGKHPVRLNITDWIPGQDPKNEKLLGPQDLDELPLQENTLAEILQSNGYATFFAGKWHLGDEGYFPENQGFESNKGGHDKGSPPGGYYTPYKNPKLTDGPEGEYLTDRLTDESIQFLEGAGENPFLLFLSFYTVHTPIQAHKASVSQFNEKLENLDLPDSIQKEEGRGVTRLVQSNADYASMVYAMDQNVGRLVETLKQQGLYENTLLIFTSDNGGLSTLLKNRNLAPTSVLPLRGGKGWLYEGGIRVPLLIKPPNYSSNGKVLDAPVIGHDFLPTILSYVGVEQKQDLDGKSLQPLIENGKNLDRTSIYWHYPHYHGSGWTPGSAIRQGDWKLIEFHETNRVELYNLADDLSELKDVSSTHTEKVKELQALLQKEKAGMGAKPAIKNPDFVMNDN